MSELKTYVKIPLDQILSNPWQPRKMFPPEEIESLALSIQTYGLIQPITVRKVAPAAYELVAGERRFRAAALAHLPQIEAFVIDATNQDSATLALIENVEREDLHFFEEAAAIAELMREHDLTQEQVSARLHQKQSTVANKLRILKLSNPVKQAIVECGLTQRHARALLKLPDEKTQLKVIKILHKKNMNVRQTQDYIASLLCGNTPAKKQQMSRFYCDNKLYINSVKQVVRQMEQSGVKASFDVQEQEDKLILSIEINK